MLAKTKIGISLFSLIILSSPSFSQEGIILEQNPPSVKWRQIETKSFKIIFPEDFESEAQRMANTMQHLYGPVSKSLGVKPKRLSLVLQNQNAISNGFVTVAPRRSEFFTMPPQDYNFLGTNDWLNLLAVHEYRHVVQYQKSLTGFTKVMKWVFGGDLWSFIAYAAAPSWFWEGDAVAIETALTPSGRGKIPYFDLAFRTNLLENGRYNYHKQYLGSFKNYVPNHYVLGYHMVTHVRRNYGESSWSNIFERTFNNPYIPFNFSRSIKKETGYSVIKTYRNMTQEVDSLWRWQTDQLETTESSKALYRENTVFTNYDYPQFLSDGKIVAIRSGIGDIARLVSVDSLSRSKKIHTLGIFNDAGMLSVGGDKVVWNEYFFDPRWASRTYTVIKTYDTRKKKTKTITKKSRLSGTSISPDGKKIVAIENATTSQNTIVILDANSGKELIRFGNPENYFYSMPRWSNDGKYIVVLKSTDKGKTITQFTSGGNESKDLLPLSFENVGHPIQYDNYLLYNSAHSGIDNIYALNIETGQRFQVTSKLYGSYNPAISPDGETLAFNNFTEYGMDVETMSFDPENWKLQATVEDRNVRYYEPLIEQEGNKNILTSIPEKTYEVKKYSQFKNLINPYSFYPVFDQVNKEFGAIAYSQNILSTMYTGLGITFNGNEGQPYAFGRFSFQGWYPIIDVEAGIGTRAISLVDLGNLDFNRIYTWTEKTAKIGLRLPLNLTRNKYYRGLTLGLNTSFTSVTNYTIPDYYSIDAKEGILQTAEYSASFYSLLKQAHKDVTTKWGVSGFVIYRNTPTDIDFTGSLFAAEGKLYFPGLFKHHGFQVRANYQFQETKDYFFQSPVFFPRGYNYEINEQFFNTSLEYKFPIWNADVHLGSIINFQRFKGKVFYDRGRGFNQGKEKDYESVGLELHTDFNVLRWIPLIEVGVRGTYRTEDGNLSVEPLFFQFNL